MLVELIIYIKQLKVLTFYNLILQIDQDKLLEKNTLKKIFVIYIYQQFSKFIIRTYSKLY